MDLCSHGRPDHQDWVPQLREALGLNPRPPHLTPLQGFTEALAEIERLRSQG